MDFSLGLWTAPFPATPGPARSTCDEDSSTPQFNTSDSALENTIDESIEVALSDSTMIGTPDNDEDLTDRSSQVLVRNRNTPMPRKGHTKSRKGCYSCKRRKIKCNETKPKCSNCVKAEITCEYPKAPPQQAHIRAPIPQPQSTPTVFSMTDLKLFHHFIVKGYPHLPIGADQIWKLEIPAFAHEVSTVSRNGLSKMLTLLKYEFLMRSILALGASHLTITTNSPAEMETRALTHRIQAVSLLNKALSHPARTKAEADARFATFMNLTFQSTCMKEGLIDFLTMLRGCILQNDISDFGEVSAFASSFRNKHMETMETHFDSSNQQDMDFDEVDGGVQSLSALRPLLQTDLETQYHGHLTELVLNAYTSPRAGKSSFSSICTEAEELNLWLSISILRPDIQPCRPSFQC
jgi:hypothetical protein